MIFTPTEQVYAAIDELVEYGNSNTDLYVQNFSMGKSQGDNGLASLDMPYLIIAKSEEACPPGPWGPAPGPARPYPPR